MSNYDLVDRAVSRIEEKAEARGVHSLTPEEAVPYHIWGGLGIIGNGSFQFFFENKMDPEATAQAYERLGLPAVAECFRLAHSLLPDDYHQLD